MKTVVVIILFLIINNAYSQSLKLDYKNVGDIWYHNSITLGHQFDGVNGPPMVAIYLWDLKSNETKLLLTEKWESDNWHYHSFNVSGWKTGSYKFIVGFGKDTSLIMLENSGGPSAKIDVHASNQWWDYEMEALLGVGYLLE